MSTIEFEQETLTVAEHWLPAIINGDYSGLNDEEIETLNDWLEENAKPSSVWTTYDYPEFDRDTISGYMAKCYIVTHHYRPGKQLVIDLQVIGEIDKGIDGRQQYVLLTNKEDGLTLDEAHQYLTEHFWRDCNHPGGYFCRLFDVFQKTDNQVIGIIHHQYDN